MTGTLIANGYFIDGTGSEPEKNTSIYLRGDRVEKTGSTSEMEAFAEAHGAAAAGAARSCQSAGAPAGTRAHAVGSLGRARGSRRER